MPAAGEDLLAKTLQDQPPLCPLRLPLHLVLLYVPAHMHTFSKVRALIHLINKSTTQSTFENACRLCL